MTKKYLLLRSVLTLVIILYAIPQGISQTNDHKMKFDFGNGTLKEGFTQVTGDMKYDSIRGYGFISDSTIDNIIREIDDPLLQDFCTSSNPFYFMIDLPEGNYKIDLSIGDEEEETYTTVKAESRRLMLESVKTNPGEFVTKTIMVNVRTPRIDSTESIHLKTREINYLNWDNKLILEFNSSRPCINAIEISPAKDILQVFLAGNSTVVDQEHEPWCSWGQMIPNFFSEEVVVVNLAESGDALKSFKGENRLKKLLSMIDSGDYVFIEFGHNDQKPANSAYVEPFTGYKDELKDYIRQIRLKGGNPILASPTQRRSFDSLGMINNTHGDYPKAMHEVAEEESVPYIDLNAMSKVLFETLGVEGSKKAFVHYPANSFPGQEEALADNSHFSPYGAYQLAKCILQGIISQDLELKKYIINFKSYNPQEPDLLENFSVPSSPSFLYIKPDGS
jgi:lysophospholipase L1-like esterase